LLVLPHLVVVAVVTLLALLLVVVGWIAALVLGRLPRWIAAYEMSVIAYATRVSAYGFWLAGEFPPFSLSLSHADYPVRVEIRASRLSRLKVFFRLLLVLPVAIVANVASNGLLLFSPILWIVTLVRGRMPQLFFSAVSAVIRYQARVNAYWYLATDSYPRRLFGDDKWTPAPEGDGRELRVSLSQGAKRLVALFLLVGLAAWIGNVVVQQNLLAQQSALDTAQMNLETAFQGLATCAGLRLPLHCEQTAELEISDAFDEFGTTLSGISFSGSQAVRAARLARQAHTVARAFSNAGVAATDGASQRAFRKAQIEFARFEVYATALLGHPL
jgi:hypothetical protein